MSYVLENEFESERLDKQARLKNYSVADELRFVEVAPGSRVLDAGCGSGAITRHLVSVGKNLKVEACDLSEMRLRQAGTLFADQDILFFHADLEAIPQPDESYDHVFSRFVFQHLERPARVAREFFRILKPGGRVCLIDADGTLFNYYSSDHVLNEQLKTLQAKWHTDFDIGRKLPSLLKAYGFTKIDWDVRLMTFKGADLIDEIELTRDRLSFVLPTLARHFGSEAVAKDFRERYIRGLAAEETVLYYNKFIVQAEKA